MKALKKILLVFTTLLAVVVFVSFLNSVYFIGSALLKNHNSPVIGDLGGVPVEIPSDYARFVEYNKEPHFMDKKIGTSVDPAYQSKLRSFGFEVRYPDMASVKIQTKEEKNIRTTMWLRVGINTGEFYGIENYLDNKKEYYINSTRRCFSKCFIYHPLPNETYGLTGYTPTGSGVDVEKRSINHGRGTDMRDKNIYFIQNKAGHVTTFITCSNVSHAAAPCKQYFSLSPRMKANIRISYRKGLLPHWQKIQQSVSNLIYGFEVDSNQQASGLIN
ncbi:hypothetical protein AADZ84_09025 [Colwelliaceae bacterium MEBiC 14330]